MCVSVTLSFSRSGQPVTEAESHEHSSSIVEQKREYLCSSIRLSARLARRQLESVADEDGGAADDEADAHEEEDAQDLVAEELHADFKLVEA